MDIYKPRLIHLVWNAFDFLLSLLVLFLFVASYFLDEDSVVLVSIYWIDNIACGVFFIEFVVRFMEARQKLRFMRWGWIHLVAAVPISWFRIARFLRILLIFRFFFLIRRSLRIQKAFRKRYTPQDIAGLVFLFFILCLILLIVGSSTLVLYFEQNRGGSIQSSMDAIWWTVVTVTTVGYGDYHPVTVGGRIIAMVLMFAGIGLFSTLTVYVSSFLLYFLPNNKEDRPVVMTGEEFGNELRHLHESIRELQEEHRRTQALLNKERERVEAISKKLVVDLPPSRATRHVAADDGRKMRGRGKR